MRRNSKIDDAHMGASPKSFYGLQHAANLLTLEERIQHKCCYSVLPIECRLVTDVFHVLLGLGMFGIMSRRSFHREMIDIDYES